MWDLFHTRSGAPLSMVLNRLVLNYLVLNRLVLSQLRVFCLLLQGEVFPRF